MAESNPGLTAHRLRTLLTEFLAIHCEPGDRLVLAVSGGADSLALAAAASGVLDKLSLFATVVIVDHQLQAGSDVVAAKAAADCTQLGLADVQIVKVTVAAKDGLEADARRARYEALQQVASEVSAKAILLAHTQNDQAETVLLRLARGSGTRSLAAMRPVTEMAAGAPLWRPFLGVTRAQLEESLEVTGLEPYQDAHNFDDKFLRVRVRREVMPVLREVIGEGVEAALTRSAMLAAMDADALDAIAARAFADCYAEPDLLTAKVGELPMAIQTRLIRTWMVMRGANSATLTLEHVLQVHRLMVDPRVSGPIKVAGGLEVFRESGRLRA